MNRRVGGRLHFTPPVAARSASSPRVVEVTYEGAFRSLTETTLDILRPLSPRETSREGTFFYAEPDGRTGEVLVEGFPARNAQEIQHAVRTWEISAAIGLSEPDPEESLPFGRALVPRTTNPYFRMLMAIVGIVLSLMGFEVVVGELARIDSVIDAFTSGVLFLSIVMMALMLVSGGLFVMGARRWPWWTKARREARRRGVELPDSMKFWN